MNTRNRSRGKSGTTVGRPAAPPAKAGTPYLLLKADAARIPLATSSVHLVIATPPHLGEKRFHRWEFCTRNRGEYEAMLQSFFAEATRILRPRGHILLNTIPSRRQTPKIFIVLQKRARGRKWVPVRVGRERFGARYVRVKSFYWYALPEYVYRQLICRYSRTGDTVVHVFAGSGNSGLAALDCGRKPVLIDLSYHNLMRRRMEKRTAGSRATRG